MFIVLITLNSCLSILFDQLTESLACQKYYELWIYTDIMISWIKLICLFAVNKYEATHSPKHALKRTLRR